MNYAGLFTAALVLTATAVDASCLPPNAPEQFNFLRAAQAPYLMVYGAITPDENAVQPRDHDSSGQALSRTYAATFNGKRFDGANFAVTVSLPLSVSENCLAGACGELEGGKDGIFILRDLGGYYHFALDNCGFFGEYEPSEAEVDLYRTCARQGCPIDVAAN